MKKRLFYNEQWAEHRGNVSVHYSVDVTYSFRFHSHVDEFLTDFQVKFIFHYFFFVSSWSFCSCFCFCVPVWNSSHQHLYSVHIRISTKWIYACIVHPMFRTVYNVQCTNCVQILFCWNVLFFRGTKPCQKNTKWGRQQKRSLWRIPQCWQSPFW